MFRTKLAAFTRARLFFSIILLFSVALLSSCNPTTYPNPIPCGDVDKLITAIKIANSTPSTLDTIELDAGCVYKLTTPFSHGMQVGNTGLPPVTSPIRIFGHGATIIRYEDPGTPRFRLIHVDFGGDLSLEELTLKNGYAYDQNDPNDVLRNSGGAIRNIGNLSLSYVQIEDGKADGVAGGIYNQDKLTMKNSTISGCSQDGNSFTMGGAIALHNHWIAEATIISSAIFNNGVGGSGYIITNSELATLTMENTTISGNGGAALNNDGDLDLIFCTIVGHNLGIWSVWYGVPSVDIKGTLFQNTTDCHFGQSNLQINLNNMDSDGSCGFAYTVPASGQGLSPLANNGGITLTHALNPGSPAINAVLGVAQRVCPITEDQRGVSRPQINLCDIGAYEYENQIGELPGVTPFPLTPNVDPTTSVATNTPSPSPQANRCDLFDSEEAKVVMHDIAPGTTELVLFVEWPHPLWGLEEPVEGDDRSWEFTATLGSTLADICSYRGYSGRLYCTFTLSEKAFGAALPLKTYVNYCDSPIYTHLNISIFGPEKPTETPVVCTIGLEKADCVKAGGTYDEGSGQCRCP